MIKRHLIIYILLLSCMSVAAQHNVLRKLSPTVKMTVMKEQAASTDRQKSPAKGHDSKLCAFVRTTDSEVLTDYGIRSLADFDDIHIVCIPVGTIMPFAADKRVVRIESGRGTTALMDQVPGQINALPAYEGKNLPNAFTGKGVVVGVQDIGFDLTNPNFYSNDLSQYRIKAFWDQLSTDTIDSQLFVGQEYIGKDALLTYAHSRDGLIQGHGSHTLGTAAGSGYNSAYRGIAWESDICLVSNAVSSDLDLIAEEDQDKYTYATDALGFKYIFDYAESVGKPCVINFSEGSRQDLYGDDLLYYEVLSKLVGPGRIIVSSAGNNNLEPSYIHKPAGKDLAGTFLEKWGNYIYFVTASDKDFTTRIVFHAATNDTINISSRWLCQQTDSLVTDTMRVGGLQYILSSGAYPSCYDPQKLVVEHYLQGPDRIGMYSTSISAEIIGREADIEMYKVAGNFVSKSVDPSLCDAVCTHDINSPSSSPDVICVGATSYRPDVINNVGDTIHVDISGIGYKSRYSSVGPTFDGRMKPDVVAPGDNIISSYNSFYFEANPDAKIKSDIVESYDFNGRNYVWKADTGTSMSSPAVAGAIAVWLQAKPDLTKDEIIDVFAHTCSHPEADKEYPNNEYGYGQIDVYAGLLYILNMDGIQQLSHYQPARVSVRPLADGRISVKFPESLKHEAHVTVYSVSGQMLCRATVAEGDDSSIIALPQTVSGVVAVQIDGDSKQTTGSTLVRL